MHGLNQPPSCVKELLPFSHPAHVVPVGELAVPLKAGTPVDHYTRHRSRKAPLARAFRFPLRRSDDLEEET